MQLQVPETLLRLRYYEAAQEYLRSLPPEHFMESTPQATQRKITLVSLDVVRTRRSDVHVFNELLVQYPLPRGKKLGQVVPDNMVVIYAGPIDAEGSYDVPLQPARPFWMLEYVSKSNRRKDYDDNMRRYAQELKVPYYLLFEPDKDLMRLYHHARGRYAEVKPNAEGRCAIPDLEIEVALLDGWVRFWHQGELLPLTADLVREVKEMRRAFRKSQRQLAEAKEELADAKRQIEELEQELVRAKARGKNGKN
jgi:Putative restriction endonuclease